MKVREYPTPLRKYTPSLSSSRTQRENETKERIQPKPLSPKQDSRGTATPRPHTGTSLFLIHKFTNNATVANTTQVVAVSLSGGRRETGGRTQAGQCYGMRPKEARFLAK